MDPGKTAVVVVDYGAAHLLELNLLPLSRAMPETIVVVVENRSTDANRRALRDLAEREGWRLVLPDQNLGFGGGMNRGVALALGEGADTVLLLNPDASIEPEAVRMLAVAVRADPELLAAPVVRRPDGSLWSAGSDLYLDDGRIRSRARRPVGAAPRIMPWLSGACLMISAMLWRRVGGFDEEYFLYWEDVDLSARVLDSGGRLEIVEAASAVHAEGGTSGTHADRRSGQAKSSTYYYHSIRNRLLFASRHLATDDLRRWTAVSVRVSWEILLQGGRRQFLTRRTPLVTGLRGLRDGRRIARDELRRRRAGDGNAPRRSESE